MLVNRKLAYVLFGWTPSLLGIILLLNGVIWRWTYTIRGERAVGRLPFKLTLVGLAAILVGLCITKLLKADKTK